MSTDGRYILSYDCQSYSEPTPMEKDVLYLKTRYGGTFITIGEFTIFWDKPKYTLLDSDLKELYADQVLERRDTELWEIIMQHGDTLS